MKYQEFCESLAKEAGEIMLKYFGKTETEWKGNFEPVTVADKEINSLVIKRINDNFPEDSILGEEESDEKDSPRAWICDPIDGTIPFAHGVPGSVFALALTEDGVVTVALLYDPYLKRMCYAEKGKGAYLNGERMHVNERGLHGSCVHTETWGDARYFLPTLMHQLWPKRVLCTTLAISVLYASMLVAKGDYVAVVFSGHERHDAASAKLLIEEAGGRVTDLFGEDQRYDQDTKGFIASNGIVHDELLAVVAKDLKK